MVQFYGSTIELRKLLLEYDDKLLELEASITEQKPKVDFYDQFINADGLYNLQNAARALNQHPNLFIEQLKEKYLFYQGKALIPYRYYITQRIFKVKSFLINGNVRYQTLVTPRGIGYFAERFNPNN